MEIVAFIIHHVFPPSSCKCLQDARAEPGGTGAAPLPTDVVSAADTGSSEPAAEAVDSCVLCTPCMYIIIYIYNIYHCVCQGGTAATTWTSALGATAAEVSCCDWFALTTIMSEIFHCRSLAHDVAYQVPTAGAAPPSLMAPALGDTAAEVSCFH